VRISPKAPPANCNGAADFPAVKRPFNVSNRRRLSAAFRQPTTPMRFFALQRFRPGRSTSFADFTCPLWSVPRVWLPSRRFSPGPTLPALFQTGCAPGLHPSEVAHACGGTAFLPLRTDGWFRARPLVRASTSGRRVLPPLGFAPQECPSPECRCYPVPWLAPLLGFSSLRFVLRPAWLALQQTSARWLVRPPVTRRDRNCHSAY
jgi:hypothetical protein